MIVKIFFWIVPLVGTSTKTEMLTFEDFSFLHCFRSYQLFTKWRTSLVIVLHLHNWKSHSCIKPCIKFFVLQNIHHLYSSTLITLAARSSCLERMVCKVLLRPPTRFLDGSSLIPFIHLHPSLWLLAWSSLWRECKKVGLTV